MKLGRIIVEDKIPGNLGKRKAMELPWVEFDSSNMEISAAVSKAENEAGREVKVGLWKNRKVPKEAIIVGKFIGDPGDPEIPLYVTPDAIIVSRGEDKPTAQDRAKISDRVVLRIAVRLIRLEREVWFFKALTMLALAGVIGTLAIVLLIMKDQ